MRERVVYLDNAAATRLDERVLEAMKPYFLDTYAVATSEFAYSQGIEAREALDSAREALATALGVAQIWKERENIKVSPVGYAPLGHILSWYSSCSPLRRLFATIRE